MPVDAARAKEIFLDAMDRSHGARAAFIDVACGGNPALRRAVEELINANQSAGLFMASPSTPAPSRFETDTPEECVGDQIGPYRLLRCLGEGGFGSVYLAEQTSPVTRQVAVKLLKQAVQSREVLARFEAERQALAMMDHPAIARVFDAGKSPRGRPYFVMEYVDGLSITRYADAKQLTIEERLDLVRQVCLAMQHAHQKGVIHRDLKPGNVLVTNVDGRPVPKIIDFGIAKAAGSRLTEQTLHTATHQILGTPQYMSPEQVAMSADVDTRSDVYSLGVILYELVTGCPPFDSEKLKSAGYAGLERIITNENPPAPSQRIADLPAEEAGEIAQRRGTDPRPLSRHVRGEVDWVIMRAMAKERHQRYPTADAMAEDLERLLTGLPVAASPVGPVYRLRKMAQRYRIQVVASLILLIMVIGFGIAGTWLAMRAERARQDAEREAQRATQIADFMRDVIGSVDPAVARGKDTVLMREILANADQRVDNSESIAEDPAAETAIRNAIGYAYMSVGALDEARGQFQREVEVARKAYGPDGEITLQAESDLAGVLIQSSRLDEAIPMLKDSIERADEVLGPTHDTTLNLVNSLATSYLIRDAFLEAEPLFRRVYQYRLATLGIDDESTQLSLNNLATVIRESGRYDEAKLLFSKLLETQRRMDPGHPRTFATMNSLGMIYHKAGDTDQARALYTESLEGKQRILPPGHPSLLYSYGNLGNLALDATDYAEAERIFREALDGVPAGETVPVPATLIRLQLARTLTDAGRPADAVPLLEEALPQLDKTFGPDHHHTVGTRSRLGRAIALAGNPALGLTHTDAALGQARVSFTPGDWKMIFLLNNQAETLQELDRDSEAATLLDEAAALCEGAPESAAKECARNEELRNGA